MNNVVRLIFFFIGLFLIIISVTGFIDQIGTLSWDSFSYFSPQETAFKTVTPVDSQQTATKTFTINTATQVVVIASVTPGGPTRTPISNPVTATIAAAFTQMAVSTQTVINTSTALPDTGYYPIPYPIPTLFKKLGLHIVQPGEYLFCIGRAYGISPEAIAKANNISLDAILEVGQRLVIPDVRWLDIPPGKICKPQFASRYSSRLDSQPTSRADIALMGSNSPNSENMWLVNYFPSNNDPLEGKLQLPLFVSTETPEPTAEIRRLEVIIPDKMHAGGSSEVQMTFNPETGQIETLITSSPGTISADATATLRPTTVSASKSLGIPAVFDKYKIFAVARLDTVGFDYSPEGDVQQEIRLGKGLTWRWSIKSQDAEPQQLILRLRLHFEPKGDNEPRSDDEIWSASFPIKVTKNLFESLFGSQASVYTAFTFVIGAILSVFSVWEKITPLVKSPGKG